MDNTKCNRVGCSKFKEKTRLYCDCAVKMVSHWMHVENVQGNWQPTYPFYCRHGVIFCGSMDPSYSSHCLPNNFIWLQK